MTQEERKQVQGVIDNLQKLLRQPTETGTVKEDNRSIKMKTLKYDTKCSGCGITLRKEYGGVYVPSTKKIYCSKCASKLNI